MTVTLKKRIDGMGPAADLAEGPVFYVYLMHAPCIRAGQQLTLTGRRDTSVRLTPETLPEDTFRFQHIVPAGSELGRIPPLCIECQNG